MASPTPRDPCHTSYWLDGKIQSVEFGKVTHGHFRDPQVGPAYTEYHPNGQLALAVYAHRLPPAPSEIISSGVWDSSGKPRTPSVQEARFLSDPRLVMSKIDDLESFFAARQAEWNVSTSPANPAGHAVNFGGSVK